jgi:cell division protein FtsW (lipid II flippase)
MFELIVLLSRYLFVFFIVSFLWQSVTFVLNERGRNIGNFDLIIPKQRIIISFMHMVAFLILSYIKAQNTFNLEVLLFAGISLVFLIFIWISTKFMFKQGDPLIWNATVFLLDIGFIVLYRINPDLAKKQFIWLVLALIVALVLPIVLKIISKFEYLEILYLIIGWALFIATFTFGDKKHGSMNWIVFPNGYGFQPSEIIKFVFIFYLACVFRKKTSKTKFLFCGAMAAGYVAALVLQKDLGGALIFFMTYMIMMYISTHNEWLFLGGMSAASVASLLAYKIFPHIRVRVQAWRNPWKDIDKGGYQIVQSLFAIGTWGLWGSGLTLGYPNYVPVVESDFIFAAICEEFGSAFGIGIIGVFMVIFYRGVNIALRCNRRFYSLISAGITNMLAFQTFLILGGVTKLIPLTGVTLPFISYGGSSILVSVTMIAFLQWIYSYNKMQGEDLDEVRGDKS